MLSAEFCQRTLLDIRSIQLHYLIAADEKAARTHIEEITAAIEMLQELPGLGAVFEDPAGIIGAGYQRYLAGQFWIYYSVSPNKLTVWRIFHTKQNIDDYAFIDLE